MTDTVFKIFPHRLTFFLVAVLSFSGALFMTYVTAKSGELFYSIKPVFVVIGCLLAAMVGLRGFLTKEPLLVLDNNGITDRRWLSQLSGKRAIQWESIKEAYLSERTRNLYTITTLCLIEKKTGKVHEITLPEADKSKEDILAKVRLLIANASSSKGESDI